MTSIDQWRAAIGSFGRIFSSHGEKVAETFSTPENPSHIFMTFALLLVYSNISAILLLRAGIETNPGPTNHSQSGLSIYKTLRFNIMLF